MTIVGIFSLAKAADYYPLNHDNSWHYNYNHGEYIEGKAIGIYDSITINNKEYVITQLFDQFFFMTITHPDTIREDENGNIFRYHPDGDELWFNLTGDMSETYTYKGMNVTKKIVESFETPLAVFENCLSLSFNNTLVYVFKDSLGIVSKFKHDGAGDTSDIEEIYSAYVDKRLYGLSIDDDDVDYFPLKVDNKWVYEIHSFGSTDTMISEIVEEVEYNNRMCFRMVWTKIGGSDEVDAYLYKDEESCNVYIMRDNAGVLYDNIDFTVFEKTPYEVDDGSRTRIGTWVRGGTVSDPQRLYTTYQGFKRSDPRTSYRYTEGVGMVYSYGNEYYKKMLSAVIDGVHIGDEVSKKYIVPQQIKIVKAPHTFLQCTGNYEKHLLNENSKIFSLNGRSFGNTSNTMSHKTGQGIYIIKNLE